MNAKKSKNEVQDKIKEGEALPMYKQLAAVNLTCEITGEIHKPAKGPGSLEGTLADSKWSQANSYVKGVARTFERVNKLKKDTIKLRQRYSELGGKRILASVAIIIPKTVATDEHVTRQIVEEYVTHTTSQNDMFVSGKVNEQSLPEKTSLEVKKQALQFLKSHGGNEIKQSMQIVVEGKDVAVIKGAWNEHPDLKNREDEPREIIARYNGREFDVGLLIVKEGVKDPVRHEIFYDIVKFEDQLKALNENQWACLKLDCISIASRKKRRLELKEMTRLDDIEGFELTPDEDENF